MQCHRVTASSVRAVLRGMLLRLLPTARRAPGSPRFHVERLRLRVATSGPRTSHLPGLGVEWRRVGDPGARDANELDRLTVFHVEPAAGSSLRRGCPEARVTAHRPLTARGVTEAIPRPRVFGRGKAGLVAASRDRPRRRSWLGRCDTFREDFAWPLRLRSLRRRRPPKANLPVRRPRARGLRRLTVPARTPALMQLARCTRTRPARTWRADRR